EKGPDGAKPGQALPGELRAEPEGADDAAAEADPAGTGLPPTEDFGVEGVRGGICWSMAPHHLSALPALRSSRSCPPRRGAPMVATEARRVHGEHVVRCRSSLPRRRVGRYLAVLG